jgi:hypothetical protein
MIDEKKLIEWLQSEYQKANNVKYQAGEEKDTDFDAGRMVSLVETLQWINDETAKLKFAHERIDRARKSNAKPVDETFVFPLTVETRFLQGDASTPEYLPCRSDEIED